MKLKALSTAMAALSLVAVPTAVLAQPIATPLTQPAGESVDGDNALTGAGVPLAIAAVIAAGLGLYVAIDNPGNNNNNGGTPVSP